MTVIAGLHVGPQWDWGDRLRKIRRHVANVSQAEMARIVGVKTPTYGAWESGRNEPGYKLALQVARRLEAHFPGQVSAAWVLGQAIDLHEPASLPRMDSNHQPPDYRLHNRKPLHSRLFGFGIATPPSA